MTLRQEMKDKEFRDSFVDAQTRTFLILQIRALREERGWTQENLAERAGMTQAAIARLENREYGNFTLKTLLRLSAAFDVPISVQFVEWKDWDQSMKSLSPDAMQRESYKP